MTTTIDLYDIDRDGQRTLADTFTLHDDGTVTYEHGRARAIVATMVRRCGSLPAAVAALRSWSNGYVATVERR
jgi:hypothetical protein